ncbi:MAG TPA: zinc ribbon domain-containing protein [Planctomycetota bacterium]|nr:zinc ribbon domain-containing protein [Planctomycetota bacterium]
MPTYEYACTACDHRFERFESITAKPDTSCPKCKKKKAERQISGGGGFLFKGSGFYVTDYKKSSGSSSETSSKPAETGHTCTGACAHASGGAESKPAKSESKSGKNKVA